MSVWLPALISVAGALLAFLGARLGVHVAVDATAQRDEQARRDEWGRRFASALTLIADDAERRQVIGKAVLSQLLHSELATGPDRDLAGGVFALDVVQLPIGGP